MKRSFALAGVLALAAVAAGQDFIQIRDGIVIQGLEAPVVVPSTTPGVDGEAAEAEPETPRLLELKALLYDRRPSMILDTWATPPKEYEEEDATPETETSPEDESSDA